MAIHSRSDPGGSADVLTALRPDVQPPQARKPSRLKVPAPEHAAYTLAFEQVAAGPQVRSSYHADQHVPQQEPGVGPVARAAGIGAVAR